MSKSLVQIVSEINQTEALIAANEGLLPPELEAAIDGLNSELTIKAGNYDKMINHLEARAKAWRAEAKKYSTMAQSLEKHATKMHDKIKATMLELGLKEIIANDMKWVVSSGGSKVVYDNENAIPVEFKILRYDVDSDKIKKEFETKEVPGCHIETIWKLGQRVYKGG